MAPPHKPVFPPCGTIAVPASAQARTTAATCSALAGETMIAVFPW
jgi:hypothetical protein